MYTNYDLPFHKFIWSLIRRKIMALKGRWRKTMNVELLLETYPILMSAEFVLPTGSQTTVTPPPSVPPSDIDFLVKCSQGPYYQIMDKLVQDGFSISKADGYKSSKFTSIRKGNVNLILTTNKKFFDSFSLATELAKILNVSEKEKRVAIYEALVDGNLSSFYEE